MTGLLVCQSVFTYSKHVIVGSPPWLIKANKSLCQLSDTVCSESLVRISELIGISFSKVTPYPGDVWWRAYDNILTHFPCSPIILKSTLGTKTAHLSCC